MSHLLAVFGASFGFIFLKALQQRNVQHNDFVLVFPTSMAMAAFEIYVIAQVAVNGYGVPLVLAWGSGAGLGALAAMALHNMHLKRKAA